MSCTFYWWDHDYACRVTGKKVDDDVYKKYCRGYYYSDCPVYKSKMGSSSSGCFLTSACVEARGLDDSCEELTTLRAFRDGYMRGLPNGAELVREYYRIAPAIVEAIRREADCKGIFDEIYTELVKPCVELIRQGKNAETLALYQSTTQSLARRFINE